MSFAIAPVRAGDVLDVVSGGSLALGRVTARVGGTDGDVLAELYQCADAGFVRALEQVDGRARAGRVDLLVDHRLDGGGMGAEIQRVVGASGGRITVHGGGDPTWFQHAKAVHLARPDGPESWLGNLAPIPDTQVRTELTFVTRGDAAALAQGVGRSAHAGGGPAAARAIEDAAAGGVLTNDPLAGAYALERGVQSVLDAPRGSDLLVVTKGIEDTTAVDDLIGAHRSGRSVRVFVRDIAHADAESLAAAGVPTWIVSGGLKARVNAFFAGDRGVVGSAFLWRNMLGDPGVACTSRDTGLLFDGTLGARVRDAALATVVAMPSLTPVADAVRARTLLEHI